LDNGISNARAVIAVDFYQPPKSDVKVPTTLVFKPVKGIVLGILIGVGVLLLASYIEIVISVTLLSIGNLSQSGDADPYQALASLAKNRVFLITDIVLSGLILFWAGRVQATYAPGKEIKFGLLLAVIVFCVLTVLSLAQPENLDTYPQWYTIVSMSLPFPAIQFGAYSRRRSRRA